MMMMRRRRRRRRRKRRRRGLRHRAHLPQDCRAPAHAYTARKHRRTRPL
jgi:hypothetical protein